MHGSSITPPRNSLPDRWWSHVRRAAIFCLVVLPTAACAPGEDAGPPEEGETGVEERPGGTAVLCVPSQPQSLNPLVTPDQRASDLAPLVFTPLVRYAADGEIEPYLAREWSWEDERRRLIFRLREDLRWHDGSAVRGHDVAWTLQVASRPAYGYPAASDFSSLAEVEARDSSTVVVRFEEPFAAGMEPFASVPILPRHLLGDLGPEEFGEDGFHRAPIGSGPYRFAGRRSDGSLVYERFEGFPEELGARHLDRVVVRVIPETGAMVAELRVRGVDACITVSGAAEQLGRLREVELVSLRPAGQQFVALDSSEEPFGDVGLRRGLSAALERSAIAAVTSPLSEPSPNPLPASSPWFDPGLAQPDDQPGLADSLLAAAGWTRADDGEVRRGEEGEELRFTIVATPQLEDALTAMQAQLRSAGVGVELQFMEPAAYFGSLQDPETRPAAMGLGYQLTSLRRPDLHGHFHSEGALNISAYANPRFDSLLAVVASTSDSAELASAYRGIQRELTRDVPVLFTVTAPRVLAVGPRLRGVESAPNTALASIAAWWIPPAERRQ